MLFNKLTAKNYMSYIDEVIDFNKFNNDIIILTGQNGAGKSSIIDMITTTLFFRARGVSANGSGMDELINSKAEEFELTLDFEMNNNNYEITRRKSKSKHELELYINGINHTESIKITQQKIYDIIKLDYDMFMDILCIGQGKSGSFMEKTPDKRKETFSNILSSLNKYEILEKYTKELKKDLADEVSELETRINFYENKISNKDEYESSIVENESILNDYKLKIKKLEDKLQKEIESKAQYEQLKKQFNLIMSSRNNLSNKINSLNNQIKINELKIIDISNSIKEKSNLLNTIEMKKEQKNNLNEMLTNYRNEKASLETMIQVATKQAKEIKNKYDRLNDFNEANCSLCGHNITEEYKKKYLEGLHDEAKVFIVDIRSKKEKVEKLSERINKININTIDNEVNTLHNKLISIEKEETQLNILEQRVNENKNELINIEKEYEENIKINLDNVEEKTFNDYELKNSINKLRTEYNTINSNIEIAKDRLKEINDIIPKIETESKKLKKLKLKLDDYSDLITAWSKSGIQAIIIENALPEIETEINNCLKELAENVLIEFRTQKENKSKKNPSTIDTLDIIVNDCGISRKYETYSGGEKFRIDFACHVGLAKFLTKRAGANIDFFLVDEGLGSQDLNARDTFIKIVKQLSKFFKKIIVITHIKEVENAFDNKLFIYKDPILGSKVEYI